MGRCWPLAQVILVLLCFYYPKFSNMLYGYIFIDAIEVAASGDGFQPNDLFYVIINDNFVFDSCECR